MRNKPTTLARINALPPEILAPIFALTKLYCVHDRYRGYHPLQFQNFADVCRYWRRIATGTTNLWTHIDIGPSTPTSFTQLLLGRTRDSPIHVHFYESASWSSSTSPSQRSYRAIPILKPHILRVCSLDLESYVSSIENIDSVLNLWLDCGSATLARSLLVRRYSCAPPLSIDEEGGSGTQPSRSENSREVLSSVRTLYLQGATLPWGSRAYYGLTDLTLDFGKFHTHIPQSLLVGVLSASPMLNILKLSYLTVTRTEGWSQHAPIVLGSLKFLELFYMLPDSLELLLPLIALPGPPNDVTVSSPAYEQIHSAFGAFFTRSHVRALNYFFQGDISVFETPLLGSLPPVDGLLALNGFYITGIQPTGETPAFSRSSPTHSIHDVLLSSCSITFKGLKKLVDRYQIRRLSLAGCWVPGWDPPSLEHIKSFLLEAHPDLKCVIHSQDSTT